jgi:uncharacterized protein YdhG (YjbR/CyaY superfamily)
METGKGAQTVDDYIAQFSEEIQAILRRIRSVIQEQAPQAEERISYQMPGYYLNGPLAYFAAFKRHIGFYPTAADLAPFEAELLPYKRSKGTIQFPLDKPIPYDLIARIVRHRAAENLNKVKSGRSALDRGAA